MRLLSRKLRTNLPKLSVHSRHHSLRRLLSNTGWLFADRILAMVLSLLIGVWLARYLGPDLFGIYSYAVAYVGIFAAFATIGIDVIVARDIINDGASAGEILGTISGLKLIGGGLAIILVVSSIFWWRPGETNTQLVVAVITLSLLLRPFDVIDTWFQSQIQARPSVVARATSLTLMAITRVGLILTNAPLIAFAWALLAESVLVALGLMIAYHLRGQRLTTWRFSRARAATLLKEGWPLIIGGVSVTVYMRIDQVMIGQMLDSTAVGIYAVAARLSETSYFIPMAVMSTLAPTLIQARKGSQDAYLGHVQRVYNLIVLLAFAITIPGAILATPVVTLLFGPHYAPAGSILAVHIWSLVFVFLGVAQSTWDVNEGQLHFGMLRTVAGAVINVVLDFVLLPRMGAIGAAVATLFAYASAGWLLNLAHPTLWPTFWRQTRALLLVDVILRVTRNNRYES